MKIWIISDTHNKHKSLNPPPDVDMVIHAGDASITKNRKVNAEELLEFFQWFKELPYKHKIFVPGNHDTSIDAKYFSKEELNDGFTTLINEEINIEGFNFYGSPITPSFGVDWAFNCARHKIENCWNNIPSYTDVVITHGPPLGILDSTHEGVRCGCHALRRIISNIRPEYHIFGHIHEQGGIKLKKFNEPTNYINACVVDLSYNIANNGEVIQLQRNQQATKINEKKIR